MKNENELKELLDRLRGEVRPTHGSGAIMPGGPRGVASACPEKLHDTVPPVRLQRQERSIPARSEYLRPERARISAGANAAWSENKEALLFGVLTSLVATLAGVLDGVKYLALAGTVAFVLFSFVMALTLFGYYLNLRESGPGGVEAAARLDQLARRLESMEENILSGRAVVSEGAGQVKDRELEQKVEELRKVVKSLVKAVEGETEA